jgi:mono/diheme cytochrome c family protein
MAPGEGLMKAYVGAIALVALLGACAQQAAAPTREELVRRGEYLVTGVAGCNDCHTPMTPQGPDMARSLQGAPIPMQPTIEIAWAGVAPPIAGLPSNFTEDQLTSFLQTGVRPDGTSPRPPMPPYRMNEEDARAVAAYISTLPRAQ